MLLKKYTAWQNKINFFLINSIKNNLIKQMIKIINWNKFRNTIMYKFSYNKKRFEYDSKYNLWYKHI